jgi:predicted MPP superfamily phosphohydrolase
MIAKSLAGVFLAICAWFIYNHTFGLNVNHHTFNAPIELEQPIRIVFISDLHLKDKGSDFQRLTKIIKVTKEFNPDLILHGGDYTGEDEDGTRLLKPRILKGINPLTNIATNYGIIGNHEWWTDTTWGQSLTENGIELIEGNSKSIFIKDTEVCLRGLGDAFTGNYIPFGFHDDCDGIRITLTHDPLAIQQDDESGLYLAGHTHCGQLNIPFMDPVWSPTNASIEFLCGVGFNQEKVWLVSSGVGTSIVPLRWGAPASIELITIK